MTSVAFPGAEHTRFAHALGAAFVMKLLLAGSAPSTMSSPFWQQVTTSQARDALAAALLHDVGHGPLSHLFEDVIPGTPPHEVWTERIVSVPVDGRSSASSRALDPGCPTASPRSFTESIALAVPREGRERGLSTSIDATTCFETRMRRA